MTSSRTALYIALAAVGGWTLKAVAIGVAGGLDRSPFEAPLFFVGLACFLAGVVALGVALARGRSRGVRVVAGLVALPVGFGVATVMGRLVALAEPRDASHWVWSEVELWVIALALLAATAALHARRADATRG